jgi:hypothetical protein
VTAGMTAFKIIMMPHHDVVRQPHNITPAESCQPE